MGYPKTIRYLILRGDKDLSYHLNWVDYCQQKVKALVEEVGKGKRGYVTESDEWATHLENAHCRVNQFRQKHWLWD